MPGQKILNKPSYLKSKAVPKIYFQFTVTFLRGQTITELELLPEPWSVIPKLYFTPPVISAPLFAL